MVLRLRCLVSIVALGFLAHLLDINMLSRVCIGTAYFEISYVFDVCVELYMVVTV